VSTPRLRPRFVARGASALGFRIERSRCKARLVKIKLIPFSFYFRRGPAKKSMTYNKNILLP
jgi:hypothetical protein